MNAGSDYAHAITHAHANANDTRTPRWVHKYGKTWWISRTPVTDATRIDPDKGEGSTHAHHH